jgi:GDPmannose 4,6-dehydratase
MAFAELGASLHFEGNGIEETGVITTSNNPNLLPGQEVIAVDPRYFRPAEVDLLVGDATKAKTKLGWEPKCPLNDLVREMVQSDLKLFQREDFLKKGGFDIQNQFE